MHRTTCLLLCPLAVLLAADPSWKTKDTAQWTVEDARQVLTSSPWVKKTLATLLPRRSEAQQREAGRMGGSTGVGVEAFDPANLVGFNRPSRRFAANIQQRRTVVVCWESASAIRSAESKIGDMDAPTWEGEYYAIAVFGLSGLEDQKTLPADLKKGAFLRWGGQRDLMPSRADIIYNDEKQATVLFLFPRTHILGKADREIWFAAQIGQLFIEQSFDATEMQLNGKLDL